MATTTGTHGELPSEILQALSQQDNILSSEAFPSQKSTDIKSALDRLGSRSMITYETIDREEAILEPEAEAIAANGSHEARVFEALQKAMDGLTVSELEAAVGDKNVVKVGQGKAFKSKWIAKGKDGKLVASVRFSQTPNPKLANHILTFADRFYPGHDKRSTPNYPEDPRTSRFKSNNGTQET